MQKTLANTITTALLLLCCSFLSAQSQSWKPAMEGLWPKQSYVGFEIEFRSQGPMGKDWIYGSYWDEDSLLRCVAYREGGKWVSLPFHGYKANTAYDIEMFGDTLYILGSFRDVVLNNDSASLSTTGLLKWYNDSIWADHQKIFTGIDISVFGDSLLFAGGTYYNPPESVIYHQFMTTDGGSTWQYPYAVIHPTDSTADFGATPKVEFLPNGDILTINNGSPRGNPFSGLSRWDGQQWHSYGKGLFGWTSRTFDFEFCNGELYMGGTFNRYEFPDDPANFVARWDGNEWQDLATGTNTFVKDLLSHDSILYCQIAGGFEDHTFGDAAIPYFAGWNGQQWCGTPSDFLSTPHSYGFAKDTLYVTFNYPREFNGDTLAYINYFDGDYINGPDAICSTLGLGEEKVIAGKPSFEIFPVPAKSEVQVVLSSGTIQHLKIFDLSGRYVLELHPETETPEKTVDVSALVPGVYLLEVNGEYNGRFVKE